MNAVKITILILAAVALAGCGAHIAPYRSGDGTQIGMISYTGSEHLFGQNGCSTLYVNLDNDPNYANTYGSGASYHGTGTYTQRTSVGIPKYGIHENDPALYAALINASHNRQIVNIYWEQYKHDSSVSANLDIPGQICWAPENDDYDGQAIYSFDVWNGTAFVHAY